MQFGKITIVGVGLLGGSLGLAVKRRKLAHHVAGYVRRASSVNDCQKTRAVDFATTDLAAAVANADLVILCTPLAQMKPLVKQLLPVLKPGAVVTDVGSVKAGVVQELESLVAKAGGYFVGSHPMAGAEKMGVSAARADLFESAMCIVTPSKKSNAAAVRCVEDFWRAIGARTLQLAPELHDTFVSRSSHLPHVIAAALAGHVLNPAQPEAVAALCATGFRDTTRIASGSPEMWRDIALANRKNLAKSLKDFVADLQQFQRALTKGDAKAIGKFLETAKQRRDDWCACAAPSTQE